MSYFDDDEKMYVPLSIDTVEARRTNYFFSNKKMLYAFFAFIPIFAILTPLVRVDAGIFPIVVVTIIYMIGYVYFARFVIFEEKRLKNMLKELDDNRISEVDHFWGIDKIGSGEEDNGMIYYSYKGAAKGITSGLVVMLERGSAVGVPEGHYAEYRKVKENFYRALHLNELYPVVIEIQKQPELQESLVEYADIISNMNNVYHQRLLKLNLSINSLYTMGRDQRYVEYFLIKQDGFNHNFRRTLETILDDVFSHSGYIQEFKILGKRGVEDFYKNYLMVDTLDSSNIRKSVDTEPFENFAKVHRLLDEDGLEVPIELIDELDIDNVVGRSIDKEIEALDRKEKQQEERRLKQLDAAINELNRQRNKDLMTQEEYLTEKEEIEEKYSKENFEKVEDTKKKKRVRKREVIEELVLEEYDLDTEDTEGYIKGHEDLDDYVERESGGVFSRYTRDGGRED